MGRVFLQKKCHYTQEELVKEMKEKGIGRPIHILYHSF